MFAILMYCIYALGQGFVITAFLSGAGTDSQTRKLLMIALAMFAPLVTAYVIWILLGDALDYCSVKKETK